jgi:transposase
VRVRRPAGDKLGGEKLISWFRELGLSVIRIGLEAGPLSQWLYAAMKEAGLLVELLETRHVRDAFKAMLVKSDRNDARGIAQLMRLGWFRPVHCKSQAAQEVRAVLTARKLVQSKLRDVEMSLRGVLRGFGLKVGQKGGESDLKHPAKLARQFRSVEIACPRPNIGDGLATSGKGELVTKSRHVLQGTGYVSVPPIGILY